jgi:hypothetical protein
MKMSLKISTFMYFFVIDTDMFTEYLVTVTRDRDYSKRCR